MNSTDDNDQAERVIAALHSVARPRIYDVRIISAHADEPRVDEPVNMNYVVEMPGVPGCITLPSAQSALSDGNVGSIGYLVAAKHHGSVFSGRKVFFYPYIDQTLRREPLIDGAEGLGWTCDNRHFPFIAPHHIVPGSSGQFVPDATTPVTIHVPSEFVEICAQFQQSPDSVLRAFIADSAGLMNFFNCPRADGYSSNGSDERDLAEQYLERTFAHLRLEPEEQFRRERQQEEAEEREGVASDLAAALDDYVDAGGDANALISQVEAIVLAQQKKAQEED
ncbi:hypothetical protein K7573_21020 (plasmid) [Stenotrophomonas maltophilia]|uniref:hypothetical protein n=1 Tax=Stenotrophomonas maltophilia TaxID=40324 RepID=UPI000C1507A4|nr:hypothetical protein [Stenotrophomonas maltophilia]UXF78764.1 hypothetical protein K7573_21020 [Stenotrophomonas maltophilia]